MKTKPGEKFTAKKFLIYNKRMVIIAEMHF